MQALGHLPPYQLEMTRAVTKEVRELDQDVHRILEPFGGQFDPSAEPVTACALLVSHLCMRRNKRCLLAYHRVRSDKLEEMCWRGIDVLEQAGQSVPSPGRGEPSEASSATRSGRVIETGSTNSLSPEEEEYVKQYSDMLAAYKGQWTDIDLTGSLEPPRDLFIDVRVLKDAGEIQTEYGYVKGSSSVKRVMRDGIETTNLLSYWRRSITLTKNSQFYVRKGDVERLIAQGYLQRLS